MTLTMYQFPEIIILLKCYNLTEVAGEGGPDLVILLFQEIGT